MTADKAINFIKKKIQHPGLKKYGMNTGWMLAGQFLNWGISFFVVIFLVRYLGPEKYGVLSYVMGFVALFSVLARLGVDGTVYRDIIKNKSESGVLLGSAIIIKFWGGIISILIATITSLLIEGFTQITLFIFLLSLSFLFKPLEIFKNYFQAEIKGRLITIVDVTSRIITSILLLIGIFYKFDLLFFIFVYLFDWSVNSILLLVLFLKKKEKILLKYDLKHIKNIFKESVPLLFSGVLTVILAKTDILMVNYFLGNVATGIYGAAIRLSEFWYIIPTTIVTSFFPAMVISHQLNNNYKKRFLFLSLALLLISLIISSIFTLLSEEIVKYFFGQEFLQSANVMKIYVWSSCGMILSLLIKRFMIIKKQSKNILFLSLIIVIINIIFNFVLIPVYGINGAAIATLISSLFIVVFLFKIIFK